MSLERIQEPQKQTLLERTKQDEKQVRKKNNNLGRGTRQGNRSALTLFFLPVISVLLTGPKIVSFLSCIYSGKPAKTPGVGCTLLRQFTPFSTPFWFTRINHKTHAKQHSQRPLEHWNADWRVLNNHKDYREAMFLISIVAPGVTTLAPVYEGAADAGALFSNTNAEHK